MIRSACIIALLTLFAVAGLIHAGLSWAVGTRLLIWGVILIGAILGVQHLRLHATRPAFRDWNWGEKGTRAYMFKRGGVVVLINSIVWLMAIPMGYPDLAFGFIGITIISVSVTIGLSFLQAVWNG